MGTQGETDTPRRGCAVESPTRASAREGSRGHIDATVLVVDDTPSSLHLIGSWLRRAGHTVIEAATGAEGLAIARAAAEEGDGMGVAIVDVRLPDMSGFEVCEQIKDDPLTSSVPVIHVSAGAVTVGGRTQGLYRGADAYLIEPIDPAVLLATVQAALRYSQARRRAEHTATVLTALARATMLINAARTVEQLGNAMSTGAARITRGPAAAYVRDFDGRARRTVVTAHGAEPAQGSVPPSMFDTLLRFGGLGEGAGSTSVVVPGADWVRRMPDALLETPVHLVVCRTQVTRPPTALAVPAHSVRDTETAEALHELTRTGALAAEALRSYAEEHALALTLQRSFLPATLPDIPDADIAVRYLPASDQAAIGGDFYEAVALDEHRILIAIGDVAGHSLRAATIMGEVRHSLRAFASEGHPPHAILDRMNAMMLRFQPYEAATVCVLVFDPVHGDIEIANAGHLPPLVLTEDGATRYLAVHGPLLGLGLPRPDTTHVRLAAGDTLVLYTDGLIEERHSDLDTGMARLRTETTLAWAAHTDPEQLADHLLAALGGDKRDDIALLILRRRSTARPAFEDDTPTDATLGADRRTPASPSGG
ncbi:SpoIIE family protein phosphatase [Embleya sp. NBC_00896]|uniref:SpoIIE family protein phosphatase n=1 Tax=Embleya sp. NBC_00896 TaxID=2975961 RepID=UPI0038675D73|nr:fused response regulator/phosphatase [Embleya sp. NBC_00896]